jgi:hypothetical protein
MYKEKRTVNFNDLKFEKREDGGVSLSGHAAVFDEIGEGWGFDEKIAPGAFRESLKNDDIRALWNHDTSIVMGRKKAGTLELREDDRGLHVEISPPDTEAMRGFIASIERGDVDQMSFGFEPVREEWDDVSDRNDLKIPLRTLLEVRLFEVSPVTFPFYEGTDIALRNFELRKKEEGGFSGSRVYVMRKKLEAKNRIANLNNLSYGGSNE